MCFWCSALAIDNADGTEGHLQNLMGMLLIIYEIFEVRVPLIAIEIFGTKVITNNNELELNFLLQ